MNKIRNNITFEFHTSSKARKKFKLEDNLFTITGDLIIADFDIARYLADKINQVKKTGKDQQALTTPGQVYAVGLIHEILHFLVGYYETQINPGVFSRGIKFLKGNLGDEDTDKILLEFLIEFPPLEVYKGNIQPEDYLIGATGNKSNREIIIEEMILLNLQNNNPAASNLQELYDDKLLAEKTKYLHFLDTVEKFLITEKPIGKENLPLFQFLRKPIVTNPYNLEGQLDFIYKEWGVFIFEKFGKRLLGGKDLIHEDYKLFVKHGGSEKGTPPVPSYEFDEEYFKKLKEKMEAGENLSSEEMQYYQSEYEKFSVDVDWMPRVVMLAKNTYVWLDQLSKKYQHPITRLDQIPDEELEQIARWNFTALWLIGIWERSSASKKIKHLTGNSEAVSSAYSLYDYIIAEDLGGEKAFYNLKERASARGIRMASDMVPNHTGIFSKWVNTKPYYFIQRNAPPYPSYSFNGPDLSDDDRVSIKIEDKYYSRSDAAVVFQRLDKYTGDTKYIYHGNDGTNMPWNDTAQLNLLIPEVRESVYQTIKHVAGMFPIIRFDAAMTLSKKHFQRLWFPVPGTAGAVPSRAEYAMTREQFDDAMPNEFWREVVDRMKVEKPDTLLLAEAFWLMEGYFVRTLGMHRVYNSAFMHLLMKEENEKYRLLVKNTLNFNPEILKRYVNFMSNPDEETAVNQFGKGDKYFGVCVMMVTMPGLPMFGHGQVEGFAEKYGMEYKRAYYNEFVDENLVHTHEDQIFPLMKKRYLFSQVENFEFFDFIEDSGNLNESVFAYTNRNEYERTLVLYNNSYRECQGTIKYSVEKVVGDNKQSKTLSEALAINSDNNVYYIYEDYKTKFEYLTPGSDFQNFGRYFYLKGYEYIVLLDFREIYDVDGTYRKLNDYLHGRGVYSVEEAKRELSLASLHQSISQLFEPHLIEEVKSFAFNADTKTKPGEQFYSRLNIVIDELNKLNELPLDKSQIREKLENELSSIKDFSRIIEKKKEVKRKTSWFEEAKARFSILNVNGNSYKNIITISVILKYLQTKPGSINEENFFSRFLLEKVIPEKLKFVKEKPDNFLGDYELIKVLSTNVISDKYRQEIQFLNKAIGKKVDTNIISNEGRIFITDLFNINVFNEFIGLHHYNGFSYFNKEKFEEVMENIIALYNLNSALRYKTAKKRIRVKVEKKSEPTGLEKFILTELKNSASFFQYVITLAKEKGYKLDDIKSEIEIVSREKNPEKIIKKKPIVKKDNSKKKPSTKKRGKVE
jgi:glycosidase